jgi:hypothetical protein
VAEPTNGAQNVQQDNDNDYDYDPSPLLPHIKNTSNAQYFETNVTLRKTGDCTPIHGIST